MVRGWVVAVAVAVCLVAGVAVLLQEEEKYAGLDLRLRVMHYLGCGIFRLTGAYRGSSGFNRWLWNLSQVQVAAGESGLLWSYSDIESVDLEIPSVWARDALVSPEYTVGIRCYRPKASVGPLPVVVWLHGGGFVIGGRDDMFYDHICRRFASGMAVNVVAVDYRLSPEHKFPAALMDSYSVLHWIAHGQTRTDILQLIDKDSVVVGGDSAGGTLALGVSALARERGDVPVPRHEVLVYPGTYYAEESASLRLYAEDTPMLPEGAGTMLWFHQQLTDGLTDRYDLCDEDDTDSELLGIDGRREEDLEEIPTVLQPFLSVWQLPHLIGFPSSHFIIAEYDPLRDGSLALAKKLEASGVETTVTYLEQTVHGFFVIPTLPETTATVEAIAATLFDMGIIPSSNLSGGCE